MTQTKPYFASYYIPHCGMNQIEFAPHTTDQEIETYVAERTVKLAAQLAEMVATKPRKNSRAYRDMESVRSFLERFQKITPDMRKTGSLRDYILF